MTVEPRQPPQFKSDLPIGIDVDEPIQLSRVLRGDATVQRHHDPGGRKTRTH